MPPQLSAPQIALYVAEAAFILFGLFVWWWVQGRSGSAFRTPRLPPWPLSVSNFLLLSLTVVMAWMFGAMASQGVLVLLPKHLSGDTVSAMLIGNAVIHGVVIASLFAVSRMERRLPTDDRPAVATTPHAPPLTHRASLVGGVLTFFAALPVVLVTSLAWQFVLRSLEIEFKEQELIGIFAKTDDPVKLFSLTCIAVILAPLWEELAFRAGLFRFLRGKVPRVLAYILPSIIFAAAHGYFGVFGPLAALAVVLALAYERTGNVWVPIIAHGLFNLNSIALVFGRVEI